ncbi:hypothetical protein [Neorhizobium sp. IRS_2294]|uniref:hypothetical protein n=1 Tax=unclassified Neorhizobium TaxID=2629175 RepID=UPI003D2C16DA
MDKSAVAEIEAALRRDTALQKYGPAGLTALSMLLSLVPVAGGPASIVTERLRERLMDPQLEKHVALLASLVEEMAPEISALDDRVAGVEAALTSSGSAAASMVSMADILAQTVLDPIVIQSVGGSTVFKDNVIRNMHLHSVAERGAASEISNINHEGSAAFHAGDGSKQSISGSVFSGGKRGDYTAKSVVDNAIVHPNTTLEFAPQNARTAVRSTTVFREGEGGAGVTIGPNGIEFGKKS